jgi:hypothetical protein
LLLDYRLSDICFQFELSLLAPQNIIKNVFIVGKWLTSTLELGCRSAREGSPSEDLDGRDVALLVL